MLSFRVERMVEPHGGREENTNLASLIVTSIEAYGPIWNKEIFLKDSFLQKFQNTGFNLINFL